MRQIPVTEQFIDEHFPGATIALMAGSTSTGRRTPTSDVDLLLIGDEMLAPGSASLAATYDFGGEVFEVFAYRPDGFDEWARRGLSEYRPIILHMLLDGVPLRGGPSLTELRNLWRPVVEAGPGIGPHELDLRRYAITDLLDDLRDATDAVERHVIAYTLFGQVGEFILLSNRRWIGTGKYLPRRLREFSEQRADVLTIPLMDGDFATFADCVESELIRAGGRLQGGFVR